VCVCVEKKKSGIRTRQSYFVRIPTKKAAVVVPFLFPPIFRNLSVAAQRTRLVPPDFGCVKGKRKKKGEITETEGADQRRGCK
jgi:hypothetical protein